MNYGYNLPLREKSSADLREILEGSSDISTSNATKKHIQAELDRRKKVKRPRWYKNQAGTMSTLVKAGIALSPAEYRWLEKEAEAMKSGTGQKYTVADVLYHLTKQAIDKAMLAAGEWSK